MQDRLSRGPRVAADLSRVGAGATRGTTRKRALPSAAWTSGTWPAPDSTLDLDFVNNRGWAQGYGQGGVMAPITFSRASSGTFVGSNGMLQGSGGPGNNLLGLSNNFDVFWARSSNNLIVLPNTSASPMGTQTADSLVFTAINQQLSRDSFGTGLYGNATQTFTFSIYMKVDTGTANITIVTGQGGGGATRTSNNVTVTTAWQRFSVTHTMSINNYLDLWIQNINYVGTLIVWGAMMEFGSVVTDYTDNNGNEPRFDWGSTTNLRRNILSYSEQFDNAIWRKTGTLTSNTTLAPNGTLTASTIASTAGANQGLIYQIGTIFGPEIYGGTQYTTSLFIRKTSGTTDGLHTIIYFDVRFSNGNVLSNYGVIFNSDDGTFRDPAGWTSNMVIKSSTLVGDYYRVSVTTPVVPNNAGNIFISIAPAGGFLNGNRVTSGSSSRVIWGFQVELGSELSEYQPITLAPTSVIPLRANDRSNGLLIENSRTNRILWSRDATSGTGTNLVQYSNNTAIFGEINPNLVTNGDFSGGSTGWTLGGNTTVVGGRLSSTSEGTIARQNNILVSGQTYFISFDVTVSVGSRIRIKNTDADGTDGGVISWPVINGRLYGYFVANGTYLSIQAQSQVFTGTIDNVRVAQIVQDGTIAPDSTATASTITALVNNATFTQVVSSIAAPHTFSIWLRRKTGTGNVDITCDPGGSWVTQSITSSWARYSVTQTTTVATISPGIRIANSGDQVEIWGPQLVPLSVLTDYQPTTTTALYGWSKSNVTIAKDQTGIDGVSNTATGVTASADNAILAQPIVLASGGRTGSIFLKRLTGTGAVQVTIDGFTWRTVELSDTEWRRTIMIETVTNPVLGIRLTVSGDAVAIDYAQLEDGGNVTSPILTQSSTVTRSADVARVRSDLVPLILNQGEGTLYAELAKAMRNFPFMIGSINNPSNARFATPYFTSSTNITLYILDTNLITVGGSTNVEVKVATAVKYGYASLVVNYGNITTSFVETNNVPSRLIVSNYSAVTIGHQLGGIDQLNGCIKRFVYFKKAHTTPVLTNMVNAI